MSKPTSGGFMKHDYKMAGGTLLLILVAIAAAQTPPTNSVEVAPGFKLRPNGVIDIGDAYAEVNYYDSKWTIAQQHDKFQPTVTAPTSAPSAHMISGVLTTAGGPANLTELIEPADGGISYSARLISEKPLDTNELSAAFILPLKTFGGKQIMIDQQPFTLPMEPAKKGEARVTSKDNVHEVDVPTPDGMLIITGNFSFL